MPKPQPTNSNERLSSHSRSQGTPQRRNRRYQAEMLWHFQHQVVWCMVAICDWWRQADFMFPHLLDARLRIHPVNSSTRVPQSKPSHCVTQSVGTLVAVHPAFLTSLLHGASTVTTRESPSLYSSSIQPSFDLIAPPRVTTCVSHPLASCVCWRSQRTVALVSDSSSHQISTICDPLTYLGRR